MKITKFFFLLTFILTGLLFSSCSSDDDNDNSSTTTQYGPQNVFTGELPKYMGASTLTYNSDGLLEKISNNYQVITFEYPSRVKSTNNNDIVIVKFAYTEDPEDNYSIKLEIGDNGFATRALQTYADNSTDTWEFKYNSDGQLNYMKRSEGDNEVTTITYTNGNISNVKRQSDDAEEGIYTSSIFHTSEAHPQGIENKGCIMLFDATFGIDMDEMDCVYYAGLLGRATKNLPLKMTDSDEDAYLFNWTLNSAGYPTNFSYNDNEYIENIDIKW